MNERDTDSFVTTIGTMLDEAARLCEAEGLAPSTSKARLAALERLFRAVPALDPKHIAAWLDGYTSTRTGKPLGPHGKNAYIIAAKWYLRRTALVSGGQAMADRLARYRAPDSPGRCLDPDEIEALLAVSPTTRHELAFRLVAECGFRPHEVLSIRVKDVSPARYTGDGPAGPAGPATRAAWVQLPDDNPVTPSRKNKTGARPVPVFTCSRRLLELCDEARREGGDDARLFPWGHKHLSVTFHRMKARLAAERAREHDAAAAVPFAARLYDLRHTAITMLYLDALPDQVIRKIVGWSPSSRMPDIYVHVTRAHVDQAFEALAAMKHASMPPAIAAARPAVPRHVAGARHPFLDRRQG